MTHYEKYLFLDHSLLADKKTSEMAVAPRISQWLYLAVPGLAKDFETLFWGIFRTFFGTLFVTLCLQFVGTFVDTFFTFLTFVYTSVKGAALVVTLTVGDTVCQ